MAPVTMSIPRGALYVGSYVRVPVKITAASGLTLDELAFEVDGGLAGGLVSLSRDETFNEQRPTADLHRRQPVEPALFMFEYAVTGDDRADKAAGLHPGDIRERARIPNEVGLHAVIEDPRDSPRHKLDVLGGAQVQVVQGRGTRFEDVVREGSVLTGRVVAIDGILPRPTATVRNRRLMNETVKLGRGATFKARLPERWDTVRAYFLPAAGFGDCVSGTIRNA
jgi:hypothetical protein